MSKPSKRDHDASVDLVDEKGNASKTRLRLWLRLLKTTKLIEAELREHLRRNFNSTLPRFDVLAALYRFDKGLKMSEISGVLKVSNGNVTGIVDRLAEEGMLVRVAVKGDRRALLVKLTKKGREEFDAMARSHESWINDMLATITQKDSKNLIRQLDALHPKRLTD